MHRLHYSLYEMNKGGKKTQIIRRSRVSAHHFVLTVRRLGFLAALHSFRGAGSGDRCLQHLLASQTRL